MNLEATQAQRINELHDHLESLLNKSLSAALEIGERLNQVKNELPHGSFGAWIDQNLKFSDRTARSYMKLDNNRAEIAGAKTIMEAYRRLKPKTERVSEIPTSFNEARAVIVSSYNSGQIMVGSKLPHVAFGLSNTAPMVQEEIRKICEKRIAQLLAAQLLFMPLRNMTYEQHNRIFNRAIDKHFEANKAKSRDIINENEQIALLMYQDPEMPKLLQLTDQYWIAGVCLQIIDNWDLPSINENIDRYVDLANDDIILGNAIKI